MPAQADQYREPELQKFARLFQISAAATQHHKLTLTHFGQSFPSWAGWERLIMPDAEYNHR
jgi:hypothetical protein